MEFDLVYTEFTIKAMEIFLFQNISYKSELKNSTY
jgi:hypothetical protein